MIIPAQPIHSKFLFILANADGAPSWYFLPIASSIIKTGMPIAKIAMI